MIQLIVALGVLALITDVQHTSVRNDLVFLTRDGCVNTPDVVNNLQEALTTVKLEHDFQFVDISTLPKDDPRTGYPTPTMLWKGKDIFGMHTPTPPFPEPT